MASSNRGVGQHHGNLRAALLEAALEEIADGRAERLSLRAVARRAGVSPAAPYHHFADKNALLAAVASEGFHQLNASIQAITVTDPVPRLRALGANYVRFAVAHAAHYQVMFGVRHEGVSGPEEEHLALNALRAFEHLVEAVANAAPGLPPAQARQRALMVWFLAHGAVQLRVQGLSSKLLPDLTTDIIAEQVGATAVHVATIPQTQQKN